MANFAALSYVLLHFLVYVITTGNGDHLYSHTATLSQLEAFKLYGFSRGDFAGISVSYAGDVNNDGFTDVIVGAFHANNRAGAAYIVFGNFAMTNLNVTDMTLSQGVTIDGFPTAGNGGQIARYAGDVNGDGYSDVIVTAPNSFISAGSAYIIFGGSNLQHTRVQSMDVSQGISVTGFQTGSLGGDSASYAGDVNGDGISDVIIGDYYFSTKYVNRTGGAWIIFGSRSLVNIDLGSLNPNQGIWIHGFQENSYAGSTVRYVGDVNDDGVDDILVGTVIQSEITAEAYVFFGRQNLTTLDISSTFSSTEGFTITGFPNSAAGITASYAGDFNGDGIADIVMGAFNADGMNGQAFIVFGNKTMANINVRNMTKSQGLCISGFPQNSLGGRSVSSAGDLNKDGYDDVLVSAPNADSNTGSIYIIYGHKNITNINAGNMTWSQGSIINGFPISSQAGLSVSNAGDVNRDGINEIIVGAPDANSNAGEAFIISAPFQTRSPTITPTIRPTFLPTLAPTAPTILPTLGPTNPSNTPSVFPSIIPSSPPSTLPSKCPSAIPTSSSPTKAPLLSPTLKPSLQPSYFPSTVPIHSQTIIPSQVSSRVPSQILTTYPSDTLTSHPSIIPSYSLLSPSNFPTVSSTKRQSASPAKLPSYNPSIPNNYRTFQPSINPIAFTVSSSALPTASSLIRQSASPSTVLSNIPLGKPTMMHSSKPAISPIFSPNNLDTLYPTISDLAPTSPVLSNNPSMGSKLYSSQPTFHPTNSTISPSALRSDYPTSSVLILASSVPSGKPVISPIIIYSSKTSTPSTPNKVSPSCPQSLAPSIHQTFSPVALVRRNESMSFTPTTLFSSTSPNSIILPKLPSLNPVSAPSKLTSRPSINSYAVPSSFTTGFPVQSCLSPSTAPSIFPLSIPTQSRLSSIPPQVSYSLVPSVSPPSNRTVSPVASPSSGSLVPTLNFTGHSAMTISPSDGHGARHSAIPTGNNQRSTIPTFVPSRYTSPHKSSASMPPTVSTTLSQSANPICSAPFQPIIDTSTNAPSVSYETQYPILPQPNLTPSVQPQIPQINSTITAIGSQQLSGINIMYIIIAVVVLSCLLCLLMGYFLCWKSRRSKSKRGEVEVGFDHTGAYGSTSGLNDHGSRDQTTQNWSPFGRRAEVKVASYDNAGFEYDGRDVDVSGTNQRKGHIEKIVNIDWSSLIFGRQIESSVQGQDNAIFEHRGNDETNNGSNEQKYCRSNGEELNWTSTFFDRRLRPEKSVQEQNNTGFEYGGYDSNVSGSAQLSRHSATTGTKTWASFFLRRRRNSNDLDEEEEEDEEFGYDGYGNKVPINGLNINGNRKKSKVGDGVSGVNNLPRRKRDSKANEEVNLDDGAGADYDVYGGNSGVDGTNRNRQLAIISDLDPTSGVNTRNSILFRNIHRTVGHEDVVDHLNQFEYEGFENGSSINGSNKSRLQNKKSDGDDTSGVNNWTSFLFRYQNKSDTAVEGKDKESDVDYSSYGGDGNIGDINNRQHIKESEKTRESFGKNSSILPLPRDELIDDHDEGGLDYYGKFNKEDINGTNKFRCRKHYADHNDDGARVNLNSSRRKLTKDGIEADHCREINMNMSYDEFDYADNLAGVNKRGLRSTNVNAADDCDLSEINHYRKSLRRSINRSGDNEVRNAGNLDVGYEGYGTGNTFNGSNNCMRNKKTSDGNFGNDLCSDTDVGRRKKNNQNSSEQVGDWTILVVIETILINFGLVSPKFAFYPKKIVDSNFGLNDIYDSDKFDYIANPAMDQRDVEGSGRLSDFTKELLKLNEVSQDQNSTNRFSLLSTDRTSSSTKTDDFGVSISYDVFSGSNSMATYDNPLSHTTNEGQVEMELDLNVNHYREELKSILIGPAQTTRSSIHSSPSIVDDQSFNCG